MIRNQRLAARLLPANSIAPLPTGRTERTTSRQPGIQFAFIANHEKPLLQTVRKCVKVPGEHSLLMYLMSILVVPVTTSIFTHSTSMVPSSEGSVDRINTRRSGLGSRRTRDAGKVRHCWDMKALSFTSQLVCGDTRISSSGQYHWDRSACTCSFYMGQSLLSSPGTLTFSWFKLLLLGPCATPHLHLSWRKSDTS